MREVVGGRVGNVGGGGLEEVGGGLTLSDINPIVENTISCIQKWHEN